MERMIDELFPCDQSPSSGSSDQQAPSSATALPSFTEFLRYVTHRTRTPIPCIALALLYLRRLRLNHINSKGSQGSNYRLALSSLCVATKYLYDDAYHTCSWVQVSMGLFGQKEVNQMEMEFMYFLYYHLTVDPVEWRRWVATLEAKLLQQWRAVGLADTFQGFGHILAEECCRKEEEREWVASVSWGKVGQQLLEEFEASIRPTLPQSFPKPSPVITTTIRVQRRRAATAAAAGGRHHRGLVLHHAASSYDLRSACTTTNTSSPNVAPYHQTLAGLGPAKFTTSPPTTTASALSSGMAAAARSVEVNGADGVIFNIGHSHTPNRHQIPPPMMPSKYPLAMTATPSSGVHYLGKQQQQQHHHQQARNISAESLHTEADDASRVVLKEGNLSGVSSVVLSTPTTYIDPYDHLAAGSGSAIGSPLSLVGHVAHRRGFVSKRMVTELTLPSASCVLHSDKQ
ncbi:hypothetical protein EV182_001550 [Spiromyces aspiralis]|uniref:Uncharacterized protein n=1 Tax=Spiromyces aspiralis TaxID=68401 RepID=A0ACC1HFA0_9FUNG|nr:hypothetical protein EV182_001550 [Spiromyces aspiralis]